MPGQPSTPPHRRVRRHLLVAAVGAVSWCVAGAADIRPDGRGGHVTRSTAAFAELESALLQAIRERKAAELERLVDDEFLMTVAQDPEAPVDRDDWLLALRKPGAGDWEPEHLAVREFGTTAVAGFVLRPQHARAGAAPLYVVDTWRLDGSQWRLIMRHVAPATGPRRGIPGDVPAPGARKKI